MEVERKWLLNTSGIQHVNTLSGIAYIHAIQSMLKTALRYTSYEIIEDAYIISFYLISKPNLECRFRHYSSNKHADSYRVTIKGSGDIARKEYEFNIPKIIYKIFKRFVKPPIITKKYFQIHNKNPENPIIEVSIVNPYDKFNRFTYIEAEFECKNKEDLNSAIEKANNYKLPFLNYVTKDITKDSSYKMKNYWNSIHTSNKEN